MRCVLATLWLGILVPASVFALQVNYCRSKMCGHSNRHTFCQYPPGPALDCTGYMEAPLSLHDRERIVARLNQRRAAAAGGRLRGFPPAGNMLKLLWVEELARAAQRWADRCRPPAAPEEHDDCRDLYSVRVGQCVASVVGEAPGLRPESMADMWYMQSMHYKANATAYEDPPMNKNFYGDFGQLIWAHTYMVGCGRSRFMSPSYGRMRSVERLVCNFAPSGPSVGRPLWTPSPSASACPPRALPDTDLPTLCSFQRNLNESSDADNIMTLEEHILLNTVLNVEYNESINYLGSLDEIFLTRIAIMSLKNSIKKSQTYSSVQKRDVNDTVKELDANIQWNNLTESETTQDTNKIEILTNIRIKEVNKKSKKKASFVGRPKPYNIEDLNEVDGNVIVDNQLNIPSDDLSNKESDIYMDNEFSEILEETVPTIHEGSTNIAIDESFPKSIQEIESKNKSTTENDTTKTSLTETITDIPEENVTVALNNIIDVPDETLDNTEEKEKSVEDYLSDPETVQQLQEELDRIENALSFTTTGKVRRELRDRLKNLPQNFFGNATEEAKTPTPENAKDPISLSEEDETDKRNKTIDKTPMMNMVLRYMPYFKRYKDSMLVNQSAKAAKNRASLVTPAITLVLLLCF